MELIYIWINKGKNIVQQGYNFSMCYSFELHCDNGTYVLSETIKTSHIQNFFDEEQIITNITAIVGKNGSGKTSLLGELSDLECYPRFKEERNEYINFEEESYESNKKLLVFKKNDELIIYHNFATNTFLNKTPYDAVNLYESTEESKDQLSKGKGLSDITTVCLTNSSYNYGENGISSNGKLSTIILSPTALSTIARRYYTTMLHFETNDFFDSKLWYFNYDVIKEQRTLANFQQICDMLYFYKLYDSKLLAGYDGIVPTSIHISFVSCQKMLEKRYSDFSKDANKEEFNENKKYFYEKYKEFRKYLSINDNINLKDVVMTINLNLLFECVLTLDLPLKVYEHKNTISKIQDLITNIIETQNNDRIGKYFKAGINEVKFFDELKVNAMVYKNTVPIEDLAYKTDLILDIKLSEEAYIKFLKFIKTRYEEDYSFILKYIEIGNLQMSSGERAFQNFFSWLNLVPEFNKIDKRMPAELHSSILLLIDEIDLYLHPEWQKNMVYNMIQEVKRQFANYKVQIIFATHSPLVLSDIPRENTIYLKLVDGNSIPDQPCKHIQTFGTDIYTLLNDAFYLNEGSMGKFATIEINKMLKRLASAIKQECELSEAEVLVFNEKILWIGNELIRKKLFIMLDKCSKETNKICALERRRVFLEKEIQRLVSKEKE